jgi:hypothetical protein
MRRARAAAGTARCLAHELEQRLDRVAGIA